MDQMSDFKTRINYHQLALYKDYMVDSAQMLIMTNVLFLRQSINQIEFIKQNKMAPTILWNVQCDF